MDGARQLMPLAMLLFAPLLDSVSAETDPLDVSAINALFRAMDSPSQLNGWKSEGGDPCGRELWQGVLCSGKTIMSIKIKGAGVGGQLSSNLSSFKNLGELDISNNVISGQIPDYLPPNATHLDFSCNTFNMNIPFSFSYLKSLTYLNLSRNSFFGHIGNIFTDLHNLQYLDLSFNNFSGDLPSSFASLTNLRGLFLQENHLTGSVAFLAYLPLTSLNIKNNRFSGVVPKQLESIQELKISGNMFHTEYAIPPRHDAEYSAPSSPIHPPSHVFTSSHGCDVSNDLVSSQNCYSDSSLGGGLPSWGIAACVIGGLVFMGLVLAAVVFFSRRSRKYRRKNLKRPRDSDATLPVVSVEGSRLQGDHLTGNSTNASSHHTRSSRISRRKFSLRRPRALPAVKLFSGSDLLPATGNFGGNNFLGNGFLGPSYRADLPGGQTFVVRRLESSAMSQQKEETFMDFVSNASRLKHPNVTRLIGYCSEQGEHLLVYEYVKSWSLEYILHSSSETRKLLSWRARIKMAVAVARALEYLHWGCSPPMPHENLTAACILIDEKMIPRVGDCGLGMLGHITDRESQGTGYAAPEFGDSRADKTKSDVFSFGVLLLELLTGRKPLDKSRGRGDESLVMWASSRFHDIGMLEDMTDPVIKSGVTAQILSRFADIVLPCIQAHPEFRPAINEVGDQLARLFSKIHRPPREGRGAESDASELSSLRTALSQLDRYSQVSALNPVPSSSALS